MINTAKRLAKAAGTNGALAPPSAPAATREVQRAYTTASWNTTWQSWTAASASRTSCGSDGQPGKPPGVTRTAALPPGAPIACTATPAACICRKSRLMSSRHSGTGSWTTRGGGAAAPPPRAPGVGGAGRAEAVAASASPCRAIASTVRCSSAPVAAGSQPPAPSDDSRASQMLACRLDGESSGSSSATGAALLLRRDDTAPPVSLRAEPSAVTPALQPCTLLAQATRSACSSAATSSCAL